ncbi:CD109 antigen-like, partial [Contarinia nasturtii]|uniref:CD109 antigen-like n=1 Tax=Contarinia nasturtii TaxID=265458 RepID=UPI0012D42247
MDNEVEIIEPVERSVDLRSIDTTDFMQTDANDAERCAEKFFYTIIAPKKIRGNSNYTFNLSIHDAKCEFDEPVVVRVSIEDENDENGYKIHRDVTMQPNTTEFVSIPIGDLSPEADYKLVVKGITGVTLEREVELDLQTQTHTILIQTDKAIYKPNDCIKFRVLVLNSELKAATIDQNELIISFNDPCRNIMKKWNGVNTINGVFSSEFQLSDVPNFGEWKITAAIGDQVKIAVIEVAEYVLPKFETLIESSDSFTITDEKVRAVIRAKYTHGKPLRGLATVTVTEDDPFGNYYIRKPQSKKNKQDDDDNNLVKKSFNIDGEETIEFDIKNELKFDLTEKDKWLDVKNYKIKVEVTEGLTGLTQTTDKTIKIHKNTYQITTDLHTNGPKRDTPCDINISVRKADGTVLKFIDPNKKKITVIRERFYTNVDESTTDESVHELDETGDAYFAMDVEKNESSFSIKVKYAGQETDLGMFYSTSFTVADRISLRAKVLTEQCSINKPLEVEVMSHYPFSSYTYLIVCRGKILETKTVVPAFTDTDASEYTHRFTFIPTFDYAPQAQIIVYCVRDNAIVSATQTADLYDDFKNFIDLDVAPNTAKPGQIVDINVKSNPNSYIGLLGIDKSVMLLRGGNDLARDGIWNELELFSSEVKRRSYIYENKKTRNCYYSNAWEDFSKANLITLTNTLEPIPIRLYCKMMACDVRSSCFSEPEGGNKPIIRQDFPETWIWDSIADKSFNGSLSLKRKVPDSLTTWVLTGFSICPINGLALTKKPSELCVQQPFHVSLNLPFSVKRGEVLTVPCSIFNYLPNQIETEIIFENEHNEFEFVDASVDDKIYPEIRKQTSRKKKLTILSDDAMNAFFTIRPTKVGVISLKVSAISETASDCLIKTLNVECEGVPQFVNKAVFVDLREKSQIEPIDVAIEIPKTALPDST